MFPADVTAQYFPWRMNVQIGTLHSRSNFVISPTIEHSSFSMNATSGQWWQIGVERKLKPHMSIKIGLGQMRLPYTMNVYQELLDGSGRIRLTSNGSGNGGDILTYASTGVKASIPVWGPFSVTGGVDLTVRYNREAKSTFIFGSSGKTTLTEGRDTLRLSHSFRFTPEATPSFTLAIAPHLGIDWQVGIRTTAFVSGTYNMGLGSIRKAVSAVESNDQRATARFESRGSFIGYQVGISYAFGRLRSNM